MVGAKQSTFMMEGYSLKFAPTTTRHIWDVAVKSGFSQYFLYSKTGPIEDDHYYVNTIAGIPTVDIIHRDPGTISGFGSYWHTHDDDLDVIDKNVLRAVGQTVINVLYLEAAQ